MSSLSAPRLLWLLCLLGMSSLVTACSSSEPKPTTPTNISTQTPPSEAAPSAPRPLNPSPDGKAHPGEIVHVDHTSDRTWTMPADQVPQSVAWAQNASGGWSAVVKIEITGSPTQRTILSYDAEGSLLQTLTQAAPAP